MPNVSRPAATIDESEDQLVSLAQEAVSQCRWVVGECAAKWTQRYARGRTDADFASLIGLSGDQVYQRRRVWEVFSESRGEFPTLKWSHFYAALNWDDQSDCLRWADEMKATVAEMRAWRRAQRGEDLMSDAGDEALVHFLPTEPEAVQDPSQFAPTGGGEARAAIAGQGSDRATLAGVARQTGGNSAEYSPYRADAGSPAPAGGHTERAGTAANPPTVEQLVKRMIGTLDRCSKLLTPEFRREFQKLPEPLRQRFAATIAELAKHAAKLS